MNLVFICSHDVCKKFASFASCGQIEPEPTPKRLIKLSDSKQI